MSEAVMEKVQQADHEAQDLAHYISLVHWIADQADLRILQGIKLAADEKLYSLFEEHTELIQRGKVGKSIELGHKI